MSTQAKDLTKDAPASPKSRVGGYVILARLADKARADFGASAEYHRRTIRRRPHAARLEGRAYDEVKKADRGRRG